MSRSKKPERLTASYKLKHTLKGMYAERSSYFMIAPFLIAFFIFTVLPVVAAIALSFTDFNMLQTPNWVGFDNYETLFLTDDVFIIAVKNTLILALITGPVGYMACFIFAWFINELPRRIRTFMTLIFYAPSISGSIFFIWTFILSSDRYGVVNGLLLDWGIIDTPILWLSNTDYMLICVIIVQLWLSLGTSFLSFLAGFKTVDTTLYEAGAIDGVHNRFQEIWYLTLPQMKPQLLFGAVMQISSSFAVGPITEALCGMPSTDYAVHTIINHVHDYGNTRYELGYACAISTVLLMVMLMVNKIINKVLAED